VIDKSGATPLYYQVKEDLLGKISSGVFKVGEAIPPEQELQEMYKVSRITIRRAIQELVLEGFLKTRQGLGTFVSRPKVKQNLNYITSWAETMTGRGMRPETKSILITEEKAPLFVAKQLGINPGDKVHKVERLRYAEEEPVCIMTNYLHPGVTPGLVQEGLMGESLYETLEKRYNVKIARAVETVEATAARAKESKLLGVRRGSPLLVVTRVTYDENDRPFEVVIASNRADKYAYTVNLVGRPK